MTSPTATRTLPRSQLVAALLVGCVVVLLGLASGLGLTTPAAPVSAPQPTLSMQTGPGTTGAAASPRAATTPGVSYVAVPAPAPAPAAGVIAAPQPTVTPTSAAPPSTPAATPSQPAPATGTPTPPPPAQQCPAGLLAGVIALLNRTAGGGFLGGLLGGVLDALGLSDLTEVATLTPGQRAVRVRDAVLGPLRPAAAAAGDPPAVAKSCTAALDLRLRRAASR